MITDPYLIHELVPEGEFGDAKVEHVEVSGLGVDRANMGNRRMGIYCKEMKDGDKITRLLIKRQTMMSNAPMEISTNHDVLARANGRVLIMGLGLGVILLQILANKDVKEVFVVENNIGVLRLVGPSFIQHPKLKLFYGDAHDIEWIKGYGPGWPKRTQFDTIYFDIWKDLCTDNLDEIKELRKKFRGALNKNNPHKWMGTWSESELKSLKRRGY